MLRMLKYPILTRTLLSPRVYTYIYWDFDHAVMQPVEASIKVAADLPGLAAGRYHLRGYDESRFGAARVSVPWETAGPFPRSAITGQLQPVVPPVETSLRMHPPG